ncbi:hypothetical protein EE612_059783 [Oryza sativa]|nr:hypothetical protein EE612_059783 [Oryza sativa]
MSATATAAAIRSGELLACPMALRRAAAPVAAAMSFRMGRAATARAGRLATRVRVRVVAAAEEGAAEEKSSGKKKRAASGIMKPKPISAELREFVGGAEELPRTEALKIIWAHIKGNNLQVCHTPPTSSFPFSGVNFCFALRELLGRRYYCTTVHSYGCNLYDSIESLFVALWVVLLLIML